MSVGFGIKLVAFGGERRGKYLPGDALLARKRCTLCQKMVGVKPDELRYGIPPKGAGVKKRRERGSNVEDVVLVYLLWRGAHAKNRSLAFAPIPVGFASYFYKIKWCVVRRCCILDQSEANFNFIFFSTTNYGCSSQSLKRKATSGYVHGTYDTETY